MTAAALPADESERVAALRALGILDSDPEERFDRITRTASRLFAVETALVSLVDVNRQWFKSCIGLPTPETPRAASFCAHALHRDDIFHIPDATADPRFVDNPLVTGPPFIRFYAGKPIKGPSGHRLGTLCVLDPNPRDLTDDDRAALIDLASMVEDELAAKELRDAVGDLDRAEAQLRAITESAAEGIVLVDSDDRVAFINPAASNTLGYLPTELVGRPLHATIHHSHADGSPYPSEECPIRAAGHSGASATRSDEVFWRHDGTAVPVEYAATPVFSNGEITGVVITWSDISDRREIERFKDEFVSTVSHELRTPLTSINGYLQLLDQGIGGELSERQANFVAVARRNSQRLAELIDDVLLLSHMEAGTLDLDLEPVDVGAELAALGEEMQPATERAGTRLVIDAPSGLLVEADRRRLAQCISNLMSNAIKFNRENGKVSVTAQARGSDVLVEVADEGVGIPPLELERIGTRFFRASTTTDMPGTGLGLAITRELVDRHGGRLEMESAVGVGTTVRIVLPAEQGRKLAG